MPDKASDLLNKLPQSQAVELLDRISSFHAVRILGCMSPDDRQEQCSRLQRGAGSLAICLSNRLSRRNVEILIELEPRLDEIEDQMFREPDDALLAEQTGYNSQLR